MTSFILRRTLQMLPTLLATALLVFVIFSVLPGSITSVMSVSGKGVSNEQLAERMEREFGLDQPVYKRFGTYVMQLARFDLGQSYRSRQPVTTLIGARIGPTMKLAVMALCIAIGFGVPLGFFAALRPGSIIDTVIMIGATAGLSIPQFFFGILAMLFFAETLHILPSFGYGDGGLRNMILPALTLGVAPLALLARSTRAAVLEVMGADFIRTARSKGMSNMRLVRWHLLRNALVLVVTTLGLQFGSLMGQAIVVEKLFAWPGIGSLLIDSVLIRDVPVVQGCILMIVLAFLLVNMVVDILYAAIDPRISHE